MQNFLNKAILLTSINSQNIISYKIAFINDNASYLCLIIEYAESRHRHVDSNIFRKK